MHNWKEHEGKDPFPEERGIQAPRQVPQPCNSAQERWGPKTPGFENQRGGHPGKP